MSYTFFALPIPWFDDSNASEDIDGFSENYENNALVSSNSHVTTTCIHTTAKTTQLIQFQPQIAYTHYTRSYAAVKYSQ